VTEHMACFTV